MGEIVNIKKTIYNNDNFKEIVNTSFTQLIPAPSSTDTGSGLLSVQDFFQQYETLFFSIPLTGSINSHEYLAERSLNELGISLDSLYNELEGLRQENVSLKNQVITLSNFNTTNP
jgi:hypothetical protein